MLSHSGHVMTLANSIIGASILAMPFCFQKCGIILAMLLLIANNWITRICCHYIIKSSLLTRRKSFEFLGFHAFGSSGKLFVEICIIGYLLGTCITYFVVVGDLGPQIITKMLSLERDMPHLRFYFMFGVTLVCILPLGMLKNVDSLSTVCTASIGFYVCLVIKIILESETHILANDWSSNVVYWQPAGVMQCLPIFSMALSCQMQLFEVFKSVNNQSVEKLNGIVRNATWICTLVYLAVGFFGYVAFCTQKFSGNILLNFSPSFGSDVIKMGFILSVAFSFPLVIFPCRASIYSLLYRKGHGDASGGYIPETRFKTITIFIVGLTFCIALIIPSIELIIGLVGSTIGVAICIIFPAACFRKITMKNSNDRTVKLSSVILFGGICLMVLGTYANLQAIDEHGSGSHLESEIKSIKPIEETAIKGEAIKFQEENMNAFQDNKIVSLRNSKLPQKEQKEDSNLKKPELQKDAKLDSISTPTIKAEPVPVLPVDEVHNDDDDDDDDKKIKQVERPKDDGELKLKEENIKEKLEIEKPLETPILNKNEFTKKQSITVQKTNDNSQVSIGDDKAISASIVNIVAPSKLLNTGAQQQQNIDKDAIKNNEEIAAEERNSKTGSKNAEDELKKTQNELKKTKELLERKVDEMKEELVKQNKETQNLVVEKLVEVVEKVEQIEREVKKKDEDAKTIKPLAANNNIAKDLVVKKLAEVEKKFVEIEQKVQQENEPKEVKLKEKKKTQSEENDTKVLNMNTGTAQELKLGQKVEQKNREELNIKSENEAKIEEKKKTKLENDEKFVNNAQVYEPLSYKTGEIIEIIRNTTKLENNLPLPLPLLINASRNKLNDIEHKEEDNAPHNEIVNLNQQKLPLETLNVTNFVQSSDIVNRLNQKQMSNSKENIEAIRREILQLNNVKHPSDTDEINNDLNESQKRFKRSLKMKMETFDSTKINKENCLTEPKLDDTLVQLGSNAVMNIKMQGIGRDLKSFEEYRNDTER